MAGTVYLKTNRFEVKLEGITFKTNDFESLCAMDFLFPFGKVWDRPPIVGLDVMHHPRDPSLLLLLLCFGIGCVILKFRSGEMLPYQIQKFLADKRIHFVGFGIPEKKDLFPFQELGLNKCEVDIGYLAANVLNDSKCKKWELSQLARKVLGIKRMIGRTEAASFERHEQIKCAICQLFITSVIAMGLTDMNDKKKSNESPKKISILKSLNSLQLLAEGWFKLPKMMKKTQKLNQPDDLLCENDIMINPNTKYTDIPPFISADDDLLFDDLSKEWSSDYDATKSQLKGILKCPSIHLQRPNSSSTDSDSPPAVKDETDGRRMLRRANSKGCNVSFKCQ